MSSRSRKFIRFRPITPASYHDANNYEFESVGQEFHTQGIFSPFLLSHNIGAFGFKDQSKSSGFNLDSGRINESRRSVEIPPSSSLSQYSRSYDIQSKKRKCSTIFLGGAEDRLGRNSGGFNPSCCPQMRCTSCNFAVLRFVGKRWSRDVNYLFFRKVVPDKDKISLKLIDSPYSASYCCQCSWTDVSCRTKIKEANCRGARLRWICTGHVDPT